ncbi:16S rRNA (adenine(1518)-N(6)/adenine(1519)-N(6))-dimethyltransferase RsmA [Hoyosella rhizosphaerae]|uniref:16S rRNA (adenine(1518)-N(6)/adenine(1519)-N(6))- dimethyltransferase RsmA n=1 Tax=Hoyosella rhizosphaerae TaxID=1755582 RepID=UPI0016690167|nr:16S rRNA (adenine(1518)-N(6)/adenine(1519)-N(6))-dimethyltransferase RsmA [Hoyosella rhizosphaerae]MBN4925738.1 16S rRNA (adenine(1518)-N(6)/adenine(1519)-N(6))-dimethyltransferase RsmA [Hoyosella rhizosphaerae]
MDDSSGFSPAVTLLGPSEIRSLAAALSIRPTKQWGQNFVHDPNTVRRIVKDAAVPSSQTVLEVGPGLGSLTLALLAAGHPVVAVEIDPVLAEQLPKTVRTHAPSHADSLAVVHADAMRLGREDLPRGIDEPAAIVANLPYNVAVPVILHLLAELPSVRSVLVMVQAEVADRLAAPPGSRTYGVPSAKAAFFGSVKRAGSVGRNVFWPAPNVDSGLVRMTRYDVAPWSIDEDHKRRVFAVIDAAFSQRRKTLRSALAGWAGSAANAETILRSAGIEPSERGEKLGVADFVRIAEAQTVVENPPSESG